MTTTAGGRTPPPTTTSAASDGGAGDALARGQPFSTIATGGSAATPAASAAEVPGSSATPIRTTTVAPATTRRRRGSARRARTRRAPRRHAPVGHRDAGRRGHASALLTPGTTSRPPPRPARHAFTSSPPRPKRKGSPPLRRTTVGPRWACSTRMRLISACGTGWWPGLADVDDLDVLGQLVEQRSRRAGRRRRRRPPQGLRPRREVGVAGPAADEDHPAAARRRRRRSTAPARCAAPARRAPSAAGSASPSRQPRRRPPARSPRPPGRCRAPSEASTHQIRPCSHQAATPASPGSPVAACTSQAPRGRPRPPPAPPLEAPWRATARCPRALGATTHHPGAVLDQRRTRRGRPTAAHDEDRRPAARAQQGRHAAAVRWLLTRPSSTLTAYTAKSGPRPDRLLAHGVEAPPVREVEDLLVHGEATVGRRRGCPRCRATSPLRQNGSSC